MKKLTLPSKRSSFRTFIEDNHETILEVKRGNEFLIYEIQDSGEFKLLTKSQQPYQTDEEDEIYYLDYLSLEALNTHDLLTNNYDYSELIENSKKTLLKLENNLTLDMDDLNNISSIKEAFQQLIIFEIDDSNYQSYVNKASFLIDDFMNGTETPEEISNFLKLVINSLEELNLTN